jgi:hypothetical protein
MRYAVATIGALLIFVVFCTIGAASIYSLVISVRIGLLALWVLSVLIVIVAFLAAWNSFRGTLRHFERKRPRGSARSPSS